LPGRTSAHVTLTVATTKTKGKETAIMGLTGGGGYTLPVRAKKKSKKNLSQATVTIQNK
jgi:hypothetical protein